MAIKAESNGRFTVEFQLRGRRVHRRLPWGATRDDAEEIERRLRRESFESLELNRLPGLVYAKPELTSRDQWQVIANLLLSATRVGPRSGVYFLCLEGRLVYIGKSRNVAARLAGHRGKGYDRAAMIDVGPAELAPVEAHLIAMLRPPLNVNGRKQ